MFDDRVEVVKGISILRREITLLRRIIFPLKRIAYEITNDIQKFSEEDLTKYFNDVEDHINKALEVLESSKETIEIYKDTDFMLSSERTNRILAILTIWFTLSIPPVIIGYFLWDEYSICQAVLSRDLEHFSENTRHCDLVLIISALSVLIMYLYFLKVGWVSNNIKIKKWRRYG